MSLLFFTPGEPAGIGPDLCVYLAQQKQRFPLIVIANIELIQQRAKLLDMPIKIFEVKQLPESSDHQLFSGNQQLAIFNVPINGTTEPGVLQKENASYVLRCLDIAIDGCLNNECFKGIVTGPIHKGVINQAGFKNFTGHTEYLAAGTQADVVMMLATEGLRVALVTTHVAVKELPLYIKQERIERIATILNQELKSRFACAQPRILVCGFNPHAGEGGHLGTEEISDIIPAIENLQRQGIDIQGPYPADTIFNPEYLEQADAILAMYHDQGLPVLKYKGFGNAINITLGLPFIRTSVDHGTALDLAGKKERINPQSLLLAIEQASQMMKLST